MQLTSLPPLDALRGFIAAARRKSITQAAEDLCLTQSAVSRQIQSLEERFGTPLFVRKHRSIVLTDAGEELYKITLPWLEKLAEFTQRIRAEPASRPVTISASIGVAALWLLPRLGAFQALHPEVDVRLAANNRLQDLEREGIDLAIRYCPAVQAPHGAIRLFDEVVVPVACPAIAARAFQDRNKLLEQTLLELDESGRPWLKWQAWMRERNFRKFKPKGYLHFNQYDQLIQAALEGHGVALGRTALVEPLVRSGRLVAFAGEEQAVPEYGYWLVDTVERERPDVKLFRQWLIAELNLDDDLPARPAMNAAHG
ncbi:MAG TPA: LysR substrate-binding domain-containing protein [Noviherbaspirillum sp.]|jgi:DNA-binding transcriptional LysR family regulator|uniref:LysR substrate-binding domain-containing protein n=1 Tax=Noviherbaspirillum sp. TaxID=1926288 RepID=UPI002F9593B0